MRGLSMLSREQHQFLQCSSRQFLCLLPVVQSLACARLLQIWYLGSHTFHAYLRPPLLGVPLLYGFSYQSFPSHKSIARLPRHSRSRAILGENTEEEVKKLFTYVSL